MTTKATILSTIRKHCLNCCAGSWAEVERCTAGPDAPEDMQCELYPYRFGKDPSPSTKRQEAGKIRAQENFSACREGENDL